MRASLSLLSVVAVVGLQTPQLSPEGRVLQPALDPISLASSPNGEWELRAILRRGRAQIVETFELRQRGESAAHWTRDGGFAVKGAVVTDAGMVAAYGYTTGEDPPYDDRGDFVVEIVDSANVLLHKTSITRRSTRVSHGGSVPYVDGHLFSDSGEWWQTLVLRMRDTESLAGQSAAVWWLYDLKRGEFRGVMPVVSAAPEDAGTFVPVADCFAVAGHPVVAVLFRRGSLADFPNGAGNRLVLFDLRHLAPKLVWVPDRVAARSEAEDEALPAVTSAQHVATDDEGVVRLRTNTGDTLTWRVVFAEDGSWKAIRE